MMAPAVGSKTFPFSGCGGLKVDDADEDESEGPQWLGEADKQPQCETRRYPILQWQLTFPEQVFFQLLSAVEAAQRVLPGYSRRRWELGPLAPAYSLARPVGPFGLHRPTAARQARTPALRLRSTEALAHRRPRVRRVQMTVPLAPHWLPLRQTAAAGADCPQEARAASG